MVTTQDIINNFYTLVGDGTELSSDEELNLLNKIYYEVLRQKDWEFLKKEATGSISGTEITQPDDFLSILSDTTIYLGSNNNPFKLIPFSERRLYINQSNYAYYDARQEKFIFTREQADTYSFDYKYQPAALTISPNVVPVFPSVFWGMLPFFMASDNDLIQLVEKARSYAPENRSRGEMILNDMKMWNDRLTMMQTYGN